MLELFVGKLLHEEVFVVGAYILLFSRLAIGMVFALSLGAKVRNFAAFQEAVIDFQLLTKLWSKVAIWIFPCV